MLLNTYSSCSPCVIPGNSLSWFFRCPCWFVSLDTGISTQFVCRRCRSRNKEMTKKVNLAAVYGGAPQKKEWFTHRTVNGIHLESDYPNAPSMVHMAYLPSNCFKKAAAFESGKQIFKSHGATRNKQPALWRALEITWKKRIGANRPLVGNMYR